MSAASPAPSPSSATSADTSSSGLGRAIDLTSRIATSWVGLVTAYVGAISAAAIAFQQLKTHLPDWPLWARILLVAAVPVIVVVGHTIPAILEQRRKKRLIQITGNLRAGYFRLVPREDQATFTRADGEHEEILVWLQNPPSPLLYLTGQSGSGKSSLLAAWVIPHLLRQDVRVLSMRGYEDPLSALSRELQKPGAIWQKPPSDAADPVSLLERACRYIRPKRLLLVFDQFEEFVILQEAERQQRFEQFLSALQYNPIDGLLFLFIFRSDYIGLVEKLSLPPLAQNTNWKEVPPFTENAAREFMQGSGLQFNDKLLRDVLREAAEIEQTKGLVRPVTINLCGLVLGRFASGLPRGFRGGGLIRAFLRESILLPSVRDVAPRLFPFLISSHVTKRPRTIADLAKDAQLDPAIVRGCLRILGQDERAIVRPLDQAQQTWEISHDFLVPMLDSILARWTVSLWRKTRPWLPWIAMIVMVLIAVRANVTRDPLVELTEQGWITEKVHTDYVLRFLNGPPPIQSTPALRSLPGNLEIKLVQVDDNTIWQWSSLSNLTALDLTHTDTSDLDPLRKLIQLTALNLSSSKVHSLEPLEDLTNLTTLDLSYTRVSNLEPLKRLHNLKYLDLRGTNVNDLEPLLHLTSLSEINLRNTHVNRASVWELQSANRALKIFSDYPFPFSVYPR